MFRGSLGDEDPYALETLAAIYLKGHGVPADPEKAIEFLQIMKKNGDSDAALSIGLIYEHGTAGINKDLNQAAKHYLDAAKAGIAEAEMAIGLFYFQGVGVGQDKAEAYRWIKRAANKDHPSALKYLGRLYLQGIPSLNIEPNRDKAWVYLKKAADLGEAEAKADIAWMYHRAQSDRSALKYARASAETGIPDGQALLGYLLITGSGVQQNSAQGIDWLEEAAESGSALGLGYLGQAYLQGVGVPKDVPRSRELFERAFRAGHSESAAYIGMFYEYGAENEVDLPRAYAYYDYAARHGSQYGESMRKKLAEKISPTDAEKARAILNELNGLTAGVIIY